MSREKFEQWWLLHGHAPAPFTIWQSAWQARQPEIDELIEDVDKHINIAVEWCSRAEKAEAEVARLRKGIQDYFDGNYDFPRKYRPKSCPHGTLYFDDCSECDCNHFERVLKGE